MLVCLNKHSCVKQAHHTVRKFLKIRKVSSYFDHRMLGKSWIITLRAEGVATLTAICH